MTLSLVNILSIVIVFQLALLIMFLVTSRKGKRVSNLLLAGFFTLLMINLADGLLAFYGLYTRYPAFAHLEDGFVFLLGPVLYFYTLSLIFKEFSFRTRDLLHVIPFVLASLSFQIYYHLQSESYQRFIQNAIVHQELPAGFYFSALLIYGHVCIYIILALRQLNYYRLKIREQFSALEKINLRWLNFMLYSVALILLISLVHTFLPVLGLQIYFEAWLAIALMAMFFFIIGILWKGLKQPEIFSGIEIPDETFQSSERKYQGSLLSEPERKDIVTRLETAMNLEKVFLNPDLTLEDLSGRTGFTSKKVSQVINETFNQNFFDFINSRRITEAEHIMRTSTDARLTVLEVMYACGFNSKSSFNTVFKQKTGITPSAYRKTALAGQLPATS
jgi:AraC-like DNA-binding protein